jgi:hypothetical protein
LLPLPPLPPLPPSLVGVVSLEVGVVVMPGVVTLLSLTVAPAEVCRPSTPPQPATEAARIKVLSSLRMGAPSRVTGSSHPTP